MKKISILFILFFVGLFFCSNPIQAQNQEDFLETLVTASNHSEFKAYTSDAQFLYKIEGQKLCVYTKGNQMKPVQILTSENGYNIKQPFAMTLSAKEDKIVILSQSSGKILTFRRNSETGMLVLEDEKFF